MPPIQIHVLHSFEVFIEIGCQITYIGTSVLPFQTFMAGLLKFIALHTCMKLKQMWTPTKEENDILIKRSY